MAEAFVFFSAVQAATQLIEQTFRVLARVRKAHQLQKNLVDVLERHESELKSIKAMVGIIDDEESLQTASVASEMIRLKEGQNRLIKLLEQLDPKAKGAVRQFTHQLTHGSIDENKLFAIMNELSQVKSMLLLRIQVANVGVMRNMEKRLVANTEVIERIDQLLREEVGNCEGLRIAQLLKGRRPSNDGTVPLTSADLRSLRGEVESEDSEDETLVDDSDSDSTSSNKTRARTERIILRNTARQQALQINAAVGEDIWKELGRLVVKDNVAEDQAIQVNYATSLEVAMSLLNCQERRIVTVRPKVSKSRRRVAVVKA